MRLNEETRVTVLKRLQYGDKIVIDANYPNSWISRWDFRLQYGDRIVIGANFPNSWISR